MERQAPEKEDIEWVLGKDGVHLLWSVNQVS